MKVVRVAEMKGLEDRAAVDGYSYEAMMETAGSRVAAVAEALLRERRGPGDVVILVGPGNNGGDGLVVARHLATAGHPVYVHLVRPRPPEDRQWQPVAKLGVPCAAGDDEEAVSSLRARLLNSSLVVDALLGAGSRPPVTGTVAKILDALRDCLAERALARPPLEWPCHPHGDRRRPVVLSVDLPSGMDADTGEVDALTPNATVSVAIAFPKPGHFRFPGAERVGDLVVADIGLPPEPVGRDDLELLTASSIALALPPRARDGHKGTFGSVMVVGGSANYVGAGLLAAAGAARAGCGLVTLASVGSVLAAADTVVPEATRLHLPGQLGVIGPEAVPVLRPRLGQYQALLLGPGLTQEKPAADFLERLLAGEAASARSEIGFVPARPREGAGHAAGAGIPPMVVDADGLNLLAARTALLPHLPSGSVLTPHPGEMARLLGCSTAEVQEDRLGCARSAARRWGVIVVLKGAFTVVASSDGRTCLAPFANSALASAGTGDVLAGAIASFLAQGLDPYAAARVGVYLHGLAGERARDRLGNSGVLASDLLEQLPRGRAAISSWGNE